MKTTRDFRLRAALLLVGGALAACEVHIERPGGSDQGLIVLDDADGPAEQGGAPEGLDDGHGHEHGPADESIVRSYFHDFGTVPDGSVASHTFRLQNSDRVPLTIQRIKASCGCTVPAIRYVDDQGVTHEGDPEADPEVLVLPPGAIADLDVRIDAHGVRSKNEHKLMQVRVTSDSLNDPFLTLECSILVEQPFRVEGDVLRIPRMPQSTGGRGFARIVQLGASNARVKSLGALPPGVTATLVEEDVIGRAVWRLEVEVAPPLSVGPFMDELELLTETADGQPAPSFRVKLQSSVTADITLDPTRVILRDFRSDGLGAETTTLVCNVPGQRVKVLGADVEGSFREFIDVEWAPLQPDDKQRSARWTIRVTVKPGIEVDRFSGAITLRLDDPQTPELKLTYAGI
jgi:hypothetical protein